MEVMIERSHPAPSRVEALSRIMEKLKAQYYLTSLIGKLSACLRYILIYLGNNNL